MMPLLPSPPRRPRPVRAVRGHAMVWFLALLATCAAVLYAVYNTGQLTVAKQRVVNAADAGALAGAAEQARLLNVMACGNRAMVVTDALAAQMVSLDAWLQYVHTASQRLGEVSRLLPYVGQVLGQMFQALSHGIGQVEAGWGGQALPAAITGFEGLKRDLMQANEVVYQAGAALASTAAGGVVAANRTVFGTPTRTDAPLQVLPGLDEVNAQAWRDFSTRYAGEARQRTREVVLDSLDAFTAERPGNALTNLSAGLVRLEKRGGTRLMGFDRWEAQDTWDLRTRAWSWRHGFTWLDTTVPIGWGRADVGGGGHLRWGGTSAQVLAFHQRRDIADTAAGRWSGIATVRELSEPIRRQARPELLFTLATAKPQSGLPTAAALGVAPRPQPSVLGSAHLHERLLAGQLQALSAARVYFERPRGGRGDWTAEAWAGHASLLREDGAVEYAALYNPFWQASLAPVDRARRAALLAALGASPALAELVP